MDQTVEALTKSGETTQYDPNSNQWLLVMRSVQSLDETLIDLEETLKTQTTNLPLKVKELLKKDQKSLDESWDSLKANWVSKCREISSLKKSVNRISDEKARLRDENQGLEKSITRLQGQFSQAVNSSLSEIQSLTSANSDLSDQLQKMNGLKQEYKSVRDNVNGKLNGLFKSLQGIPIDENLKQSMESIVKDEIKQIEKLQNTLNFDNTLTNDIVETAQKLGNRIEGNRVETLEKHLQEMEKELEEKNERIKSLEKQSEDLLKEKNIVINDINEEERNWFDYMKKTIIPSKVSYDDCIEAFELSYLTKGVKTAKGLCLNAKEGLADVYQRTVSSQDELHEARDNADEIHMKLKNAQQKLENFEAENEYFRRKLEQEESKTKVSRDEVISLQSRIHMLTQEKEGLELQIGDMRGGKEDFKEFCSNLSAENEKLFGDISKIQLERDAIFEKQQETGKKLANSLKDLKNAEGKCELFERQLAKLKRDYQEQSRALESCTKENEELKVFLHEKEDSFSECKNEFRNIDIVNKDLEDQVFQLTNENQKLVAESGKMKSNKKQLEIELKEKKLRIEQLLETERKLEEKLREHVKDGRIDEKMSSNLKAEFEMNEEILEKSAHKASQLGGIIHRLLKHIKHWVHEIGEDKDKGKLMKELDDSIKIDFISDEENRQEYLDSLVDLLTRIKNSATKYLHERAKCVRDINSLVMKTKVRSEYPEHDERAEKSEIAMLSQTKQWLSWILKDYKKVCEAPAQKEKNTDIQNLKEIILKYVIASTKQLEAMFDSVSEKHCIIMLLPTCKEQVENENVTEKSNEDLLHYVRETFRANQMALETAVGTLELVKLRGEADIVSKGELETKINIPEHRELCQILRRMNQAVDSMTARIQNLITNAELVRTSSTSSFENGEGQNEVDENGMRNLQVKALKQLINKRDKELEVLRGDVNFLKMEKEQLISELQEKDFDLGKLGDEVQRLYKSSGTLEEQLTRMKSDYEKSSKEVVQREKELVLLKEKLNAQQDREGDAGELSSTESARSEIERKESELKRLRSSLEDIRNVHCTNEDRIKALQNKIEGVTHFLSKRENTIPEEEPADHEAPQARKEQLLVVREIELKTSQAQFCDAEDLKYRKKSNGREDTEEVSRKLQSKEKENQYLQSVVRELKTELMSVQQSLSHEEQWGSEFNDIIGEKQFSHPPNNRQPHQNSTHNSSYENEKLRRRNAEYQQIRRTYLGDSDQQTASSDDRPLVSLNSPKHFGYPPVMPHDPYAVDCEICAMESVSGASTYLCSDDECDCNYASCELSDTSFASDDEYERNRMVSPGFKGVFSREARNVSLQEATFAIKNQHRKKMRQGERTASLFHNPPGSPRHKGSSFDYDQPVAKYTVTNVSRSNSARSASRPSSASSNYFQERRFSLERRSLERRPRSDGSSFYPREHLSPQHESAAFKSTSSQHSSDECSSLSSGSGPCSGSGADCQHDCKKRKSARLRGKLV